MDQILRNLWWKVDVRTHFVDLKGIESECTYYKDILLVLIAFGLRVAQDCTCLLDALPWFFFDVDICRCHLIILREKMFRQLHSKLFNPLYLQ